MKIIDMHCDTISELFYSTKNGTPQNLKKNNLHIDIEKMKKSGYMLQSFAMFTELDKVDNPFDHVIKLIDRFYQEIEDNSCDISVINSYSDIIDNEASGKISAMLTIEEGACCKGNIEYLHTLYRLGARMMTLTWNYSNELGNPNIPTNGYSTGEFDGSKGLTKKGFEFIAEMERLGMIIDVSHLSDKGFFDIVTHTTRPFVASHSNSRTVCDHLRNLTDDMIKIIGERGGVTGLNYFGLFLEAGQDYKNCVSRLEAMAKHARHITNVGGIGCLGLGSDFDGIDGILEMSDCSKLDLLENALRKEGFSTSEIEAIFYKNVLRVYKDVLK